MEEHLKRSGREIALPIEACVMLLLETGMEEEVSGQPPGHTYGATPPCWGGGVWHSSLQRYPPHHHRHSEWAALSMDSSYCPSLQLLPCLIVPFSLWLCCESVRALRGTRASASFSFYSACYIRVARGRGTFISFIFPRNPLNPAGPVSWLLLCR